MNSFDIFGGINLILEAKINRYIGGLNLILEARIIQILWCSLLNINIFVQQIFSFKEILK